MSLPTTNKLAYIWPDEDDPLSYVNGLSKIQILANAPPDLLDRYCNSSSIVKILVNRWADKTRLQQLWHHMYAKTYNTTPELLAAAIQVKTNSGDDTGSLASYVADVMYD